MGAVPWLAITPGDPHGIGPEIAARACSTEAPRGRATLLLLGDEGALVEAFARWGDADLVDICTEAPDPRPGRCVIYDPHLRARVATTDVLPETTALRVAVEGCLDGRFGALVTGPIHKGRLHDAGFPWPGHTDFLGALTGVTAPVMTFVSPQLRVSLLTHHIPLRRVPERLELGRIVATLGVCAAGLRRWYGLDQPRLAVCGLNPHAGEGGLLGSEEEDILKPAIEAARGTGLTVSGPWPSDSVFVDAIRGRHDLVLALYHDQGLIPVKLLGRGAAVHLSLGLPFLRTSVDHGTAYDIAGRGVADPSGMVSALEEAIRITTRPAHALHQRRS